MRKLLYPPQGQTCKVCGRRDKFNFHVPDEMWKAIVPSEYRGLVVCLTCFDDFACRAGIDYGRELREFIFVGDREIFNLEVSL